MQKILDYLEEIRCRIACTAERQEGEFRADLTKIEQDLYAAIERQAERAGLA